MAGTKARDIAPLADILTANGAAARAARREAFGG